MFVRPSISFAAEERSLLVQARAALDRHAGLRPRHDVIGFIDFSAPSQAPRFHIVDLTSGKDTSLLVAHGRGSDPAHSGWLQRFSNEVGSEATSAGAYLTGEIYQGHHGRSRRLIGLDASNSNARSREIVIHPADYVSAGMARATGKIGRSEGCLAVAPADIDTVLHRLGSNCIIYVGKS